MLGNTPSQPLSRVPVPTRSKAPPSRKHSKTSPLRHPSLECWRLRPLWMTHAREHALPAALTCSRSDEIQSSAKPEALQNTATQVWSAGACALATALDNAGSGTRPPSRSHVFPLRRGPKLRQAGSTPKHRRPPPKFGVLALGSTLSQPLGSHRLFSKTITHSTPPVAQRFQT